MLHVYSSEPEPKLSVPRKHTSIFRAWCSRLKEGELPKAVQAVNDYIDEQIADHVQGEADIVMCSSTTPGTDWTGTPYEPLYDAVGKDTDEAAKFFGLLMWYVVTSREDTFWLGQGRKELEEGSSVDDGLLKGKYYIYRGGE